MARIRSIKPDFWTDEKIVELSPWARLLFVGLWNFADDDGRMIFSSKRIKMQIFPGDDVSMSELIGELRRKPADLLANPDVKALITIYSVDGVEYLQVNGFVKHQKIDKRSASKHPAPPLNSPPPAEPRRELPEPPRIPPLDQGRDQGREGIKDSSVAKATGADAPSPPAAGEDLIIVNLTGLRPPAGDWGALIFGDGLHWLAQTLGRDKNKLRSVVGKWRKDLQNDRKLFELMAQAQATSIAQPLEWLTKAVEQQKTPHKLAGPRPLARAGDETPYVKRVREWKEGGMIGPSPKLDDAAPTGAPL